MASRWETEAHKPHHSDQIRADYLSKAQTLRAKITNLQNVKDQIDNLAEFAAKGFDPDGFRDLSAEVALPAHFCFRKMLLDKVLKPILSDLEDAPPNSTTVGVADRRGIGRCVGVDL